MIDEKKLIEERPEWLNPDCAGNEEYNKGWNACNKYWCNTIKRQPKAGDWIPADEPPQNDNYILLSFDNFSGLLIGRYDTDEEGNGAYYCVANDLFVNAWQPLPEPYKGE